MGMGSGWRRSVAASALLGLASGILSQAGMTTVLHVTPPRTLSAGFRSPWLRRASLASAAGEVVANTLPFLASRTSPGPLAGRVMFGAASAAVLTASRGRPVGLPVVVGGVMAAIASKAAHEFRAVPAGWFPDPARALAETGAAFGLAMAATRLQAPDATRLDARR